MANGMDVDQLMGYHFEGIYGLAVPIKNIPYLLILLVYSALNALYGVCGGNHIC